MWIDMNIKESYEAKKLTLLVFGAHEEKVVIDYITKRNHIRGCKELKDHGPVKA